MTEPPTRNPDIAREFCSGNFLPFTRPNGFSLKVPIDQASACIKSKVLAVGLAENPSTFQWWKLAGPEAAALTEDFENSHQLMGR